MKENIKKFNWKTHICDDFSGVWREVKIKELNWIYSVQCRGFKSYIACCYFGYGSEDIVLKENLESMEAARKFCEEHFFNIISKVIKKYQ